MVNLAACHILLLLTASYVVGSSSSLDTLQTQLNFGLTYTPSCVSFLESRDKALTFYSSSKHYRSDTIGDKPLRDPEEPDGGGYEEAFEEYPENRPDPEYYEPRNPSHKPICV